MKINKRDPLHWVRLARFLGTSILGLLVRLSAKNRGARGTAILYGHKLTGNLLALYRGLAENPERYPPPCFLTMDAAYASELQGAGYRAINACTVAAINTLARASIIVSDHGLHTLAPLLPLYRRLGLRFYDVWHGIPFKGFDADDFRLQHKYDEVWVASELMRSLYIDRYGFMPGQVVTTGYARTDRLVKRAEDTTLLRCESGIPQEGPVILFAPTWAQDNTGRSIYPFGCDSSHFLGALSSVAQAHRATVILRSHLNSGEVAEKLPPGVIALPSARYPDTEAILLSADILVCDWSSIAFDFLLLDRPTIFLDVPAPFKKGFSLGPEYRFGPIVQDLEDLVRCLQTCLSTPREYQLRYGNQHRRTHNLVYGDKADGYSTARCLSRIVEPL